MQYIKRIAGDFRRHANAGIFFLIVGNVGGILINVLLVKVLTNKYTIGEFGMFSLLTAWSSFLQLIVYAPIGAAIMPFRHLAEQKGKTDVYQRSFFQLFALAAFIIQVIGIVFFIVYRLVNPQLGLGVIPVIAFGTTLSFLSLLDAFALAHAHMKYYTLFPLGNLLIKLLFIAVSYSVLLAPNELFLWFSLIQLIYGFFQARFLSKSGILSIRWPGRISEWLKLDVESNNAILSYAKNYVIWGIFVAAQLVLDKTLLKHYMGAREVGVYALYYQYFFIPFTILSSVLSQYLSPIYFRNAQDPVTETNFLKRLTFYSVLIWVLLAGLGTIGVYLAGAQIIHIVANKQYLTDIGVLPFLVIAGSFYFCGQLITVPLSNTASVKQIRLPKIISAIAAIVFFCLLTPGWGILGMVIALLLSNFIYMCHLYVLLLRYTRKVACKVHIGEAISY